MAVYYRGGALLDRISGPGFHMLTPGLEQVHYVQTTVQTDKVPASRRATRLLRRARGGTRAWRVR